MLIRLTEVYGNGVIPSKPAYTLREVFVNPEHVVMIREETKMQQLNEQGALPKELNLHHRFTKLTINRGHTGTEIIVVGAPEIVERTLNTNKEKQLLRG
jgi:hypothetical protein